MTHLDQEERIKGGRKGNRVLKILVVSLVLLAVGYVIVSMVAPVGEAPAPAAETTSTQ
ncbi:MAG: hypothetical protein AAF141_12315 [Pseudomonadota bacterium]